jgi:SAM-dependent methyltransferase
MILTSLTVLALVFLILLGLVILYAIIFLAPWVPTPKKELERINRLAELSPGETFCELGCGTALVSAFIARNNPQAKAVGIELAPPLFLLARLAVLLRRLPNLRIEFGDIFRRDYSAMDVVYVYGLPRTVNGKLKEKLERELKPGARFISYAFTVEGWKGKSSRKDKPSEKEVGIHIYVR